MAYNFDLADDAILLESLETGDTVTVTLYDKSDGSPVALNNDSATEIDATGLYRYTVDLVNKPESGQHSYAYLFTGTINTPVPGEFEWNESRSVYNGKITIDTENGSPGTGYPIGTSYDPVDNLNDAITIAERIKSNRIHILGDLTMSGDCPGYVFETDNHTTSALTLAGTDIENCTFHNFTISGDCGGYRFTANDCWLTNITDASINGYDCSIEGSFSIADGESIMLRDSSSQGISPITIDFNGTGSIGFGEFDGVIVLANMTNPTSYCAITGRSIITMADSITAGIFYFGGIGTVTKGYTGVTSLTDKMLPYAVFDEDLSQYVVEGSAGQIQRLGAFGECVYIDTISGEVGTAFPIGTPFKPTRTLADAKTIAEANDIEKFSVYGEITLSGDFSGYSFTATNINSSVIDLNGQPVENCFFENSTLQGTCNGTIRTDLCWLDEVENLNGAFVNSNFAGTCTLDPTATSVYSTDCMAGGLDSVIDCQNGAQLVGMGRFNGNLSFRNMLGGIISVIGDGMFTLESSVLAGIGFFVGNGILTDNSGAGFINYNYLVPYSVYNESISQYTTAGTAGHTIAMTAFNSNVWLDADSGTAGTTYPTGTPFQPVSNISDARTIADTWGLSSITFKGAISLDQEYAAWKFIGMAGANECIVNLNGQDVDETMFEMCTLSGVCNGKINAINCNMWSITDLDGYFLDCAMQGDYSLADGEVVGFLGGLMSGVDDVTIDVNGASLLTMAGIEGNVQISGLSTGKRLYRTGTGGDTYLDVTCSGGIVHVGGIGTLTNSGSVDTLDNHLLPYNIFNQDMSQYETEGTAGYIIDELVEPIDVNLVRINNNVTPVTNFEDTYDGTGYTDPNAPAKQSQLDALAITGAAINTSATSAVVTTGTETNSYTSTAALDGTYHRIDTPGASPTTIELYYEFTVGGDGVPTSVTWTGRLQESPPAGNSITVYAYNWTGASWTQIGTIAGVINTADRSDTFTLFTSHVGTGANEGKVRVRFYNASLDAAAALYVDQIYVSYAVVNRSVGYALGRIWIDATNGTSGTTTFINGVADNPVTTWADAMSISDNIDLHSFNLAGATSITLDDSADEFSFYGPESSIDLNGQSIAYTYFEGPAISGEATGTNARFMDCKMFDSSLESCGMGRCAIMGDITLLSASFYILEGCFSAASDVVPPVIDFGAAVGSTYLDMKHWAGSIEFQNMGQSGDDIVHIDGHGEVTINANCTGGTIGLAGNFTITDNSGGAVTITRESNFDLYSEIQALPSAADIDSQLSGTHGAGSWEPSGEITVNDADLHDALDSYTGKDDWKADVSALAIEANVEGHAADALAAYDPPTRAELSSDIATLSGEISDVSNTVGTISTNVAFLRQMTAGRWKIDTTTNQMIFYDEDNITEVARYDLTDADGVATTEDPYERTKV